MSEIIDIKNVKYDYGKFKILGKASSSEPTITPYDTALTTLLCNINEYYRLDAETNTLDIVLPAVNSSDSAKSVIVFLTTGDNPAVTISAADSKEVYYQDGFEIEAGSTYEINALFNGAAWIVAAVKINTSNS